MTRKLAPLSAALVLALGVATPAHAHVGSPDVFFEGAAGPHRLMVTVRPPDAVPGVAEVTVRAPTATRLTMVPMPATGDGARFAPVPDVATRDRDDPSTFVGHLWLMEAGTWQVRLHAEGGAGAGDLAVPVPSLPQRTKGMQRALGAGLLVLLLILAAGAVSIAGAGAREGELPPGEPPAPRARRRGWTAMAISAALVTLALVGGNAWWNAEADDYARNIYKPLAVAAHIEGSALVLQLSDPGWMRTRHVDDLVPDHGHLMHLFVVDEPAMARVWHLHPRATSGGQFTQPLPELPAGRYRIFADIVHATGLAETATTELTVAAPVAAAPALDPDDAFGGGDAAKTFDVARSSSPLSDGARMLFVRDDAPAAARRPGWFRFRVVDAAGTPQPLEPYMGMLGHAAFVHRDASVFAHVHPSGSVPMASLAALRGPDTPAGAPAPTDVHAAMHAMHVMDGSAVAATEVSFPFGFPRGGDYRIFVQVKRAGKVDTGVFDAHVSD
jgi:hypothetical protein